ncbi:MAG: DNA repair protein RadA [Proteobacteria bacterium]|nr:DNA repair protein RadA [Pseudomonadota bacterium]
MKAKCQYRCQSCGAIHSKWAGQCADCENWNTLEESLVSTPQAASARFQSYAGQRAEVTTLANVIAQEEPRMSSGIAELDRVLGGGVVPGSVVLIGGDPGIGKSTLLLQSLGAIAGVPGVAPLYVSGEESAAQIALRAARLNLNAQTLQLLTETDVDRIIEVATQQRAKLLVVDSIQTMYCAESQSAPGSVSQVRESAARLVRFAKQSNTAVYLVGHVTKDGAIAGPRVLEHMVDAVLYFEGDQGGRYRLVRAFKNRFGAVNELGVFAMSDQGLREVSNPSAILLSRHEEPVPGSVVLVSREGTRPLLVEVQALVDESALGNPRRVTVGLDHNRLSMLLAVLHRHGGVSTAGFDVFANIVGGVRISETGADLAVLGAVMSSLKDRPLSRDLVIFGEVGLAGEIRPVQNGPERLREAEKQGFKRAIVPSANAPKKYAGDLNIVPVARLADALAEL